jgi:hypothetical protein
VPLSDWVRVEHEPASGVQTAVLAEFANMLDTYRPSKLDVRRSTVRRSKDEGWTEDGVVVTLEHTETSDGSVAIVVSDHGAIVSWLAAHEHIDADEPQDGRPWTSVVADAVAGILRGAYEVEETRRAGLWTKTRVLDLEADDGERWLWSSGPLWGWLLRPLPGRTTSRRLDFGVAKP